MHIRSSSEPPEQLDLDSNNGLKGGFPIKINGYALGSQESLKDFGTDGNGILDSDELARVAYVMDGGALMTSKEVKVAEAEIAAGASALR